MRDYFDQVREAGNGPHFYLALSGALSIPDMCAAMESSNGRATGARYEAWFDSHVASSFLSGADCYRLRCSFLHQGSTQHDKSSYQRIIFTEPGPNTFHMNIFNDVLNVDIREFCREMADAATSWLSTAEGTENFKANFGKFLQRYPTGLPPYMVGVPLIT